MSYQLWRAERNCNGARSMVAVFNDIFLWSLPHSGSFQKSVAPWAAVHTLWVGGSSWGGAHPAHSQLLAPGVSENPCHDALCLSFLLPSCFHSIYFTSGQYPIGWSLLFILAMHRWSHAGPGMPICAFVTAQFMEWLCAGESVLQAPCQHLASSVFLALRRAYLLPRNGKECSLSLSLFYRTVFREKKCFSASEVFLPLRNTLMKCSKWKAFVYIFYHLARSATVVEKLRLLLCLSVKSSFLV